jgi:hypothetical protein
MVVANVFELTLLVKFLLLPLTFRLCLANPYSNLPFLTPCHVFKSSSIQLATSPLCADLPGHLILTLDLGELPRLGGNSRLLVLVSSVLDVIALFYIPILSREMSHAEARVIHFSSAQTCKEVFIFTWFGPLLLNFHAPCFVCYFTGIYNSRMLVFVSSIANRSTLFEGHGTVSAVDIHTTPGFTLRGRAH